MTTREKIVARAATVAGSATRVLGKGFPGTVGPLVFCVGLWLAWPPLGIAALGLILWALDRRV